MSIADDLHALSVQSNLRSANFDCEIIEADRLAGERSLSVKIGNSNTDATVIRSSEGKIVDISSLGLVWWRRPRALQQISPSTDQTHTSLINNDCAAGLLGAFQASFRGKWISTPQATEFASNKPNQLVAALKRGFAIPDTLITNVPEDVEDFFRKHNGRVIFKPVAGTAGPLLFTQQLFEHHLENAAAIRACPAIFQELISGTRHIRLNCFGPQSYASLIESDDLDWRPNLRVPVTCWPVPTEIHNRIRSILDDLGLEMGIVDLKENSSGELVWLEVNPQGQFLFLEGLTGEPLTRLFTDYLVSQYAPGKSD